MALSQGRDTACRATFLLGLVAALCCSTASATVWTVGDSSGWNIGINYSTWASGKTFVTGDVLFFPYQQGQHTVVVVNKTDYDSCTFSASDPTSTAGNTNITLTSTGSSYYLCSIPTHCSDGMKLAVNVVAAAAPAPSPKSPSPSPVPVPAPIKAPTPSPASSPKKAPTPSPIKAPTPSPTPASTATPTPSTVTPPTPTPASTATPTPSTVTPAGAPPSPPVSPAPGAPPPSGSSPFVQRGAIRGAAVLSILLGSTLLFF